MLYELLLKISLFHVKRQLNLEQIAVNTVYSHGGMQLRLPRCPVCGQTMIPKYVAEGPFKVIEKGIEETWNSVDQRPREH